MLGRAARSSSRKEMLVWGPGLELPFGEMSISASPALVGCCKAVPGSNMQKKRRGPRWQEKVKSLTSLTLPAVDRRACLGLSSGLGSSRIQWPGSFRFYRVADCLKT